MTDANDMQGLAGIVLAGQTVAGRQPGGDPPVRLAASAAVEAGLWPVVVVLGDAGDAFRGALAGLPVMTVCGRGGLGVAALLQRGLARLLECAPQASGVVVLSCSRPAPPAAHLAALAETAQRRGVPLVATAAAGAPADPALFTAQVFAELRALAPDEGPEHVLARDPGRVALVPLA